MSDLEVRLRRDLEDHAASLNVAPQAPPTLLVRIRRRRRARGAGTAVAAAFVVIGVVALLPSFDKADSRTRVAVGPPPSPPSLTGSIVASGVYPGGDTVRFDLDAPDLVEHAGEDSGAAKVLPDGRQLMVDEVLDEAQGSHLVIRTVDPRTGASDDRPLPRAAHTLKSTALNFGAYDLARHCREIEKFAGAGDLEAAGRHGQALDAEYQAVQTELEGMLDR